MAIGHPSDALSEVRSRVYDGFVALVERAKTSGALRADFSPEDIVLLLMATPGSCAGPDVPGPPPPTASSRSPLTASVPRGPVPRRHPSRHDLCWSRFDAAPCDLEPEPDLRVGRPRRNRSLAIGQRERPPSTGSAAPVTALDLGLTSQTIIAATSSGSISRSSGCWGANLSADSRP